jgi:hypothetical protein
MTGRGWWRSCRRAAGLLPQPGAAAAADAAVARGRRRAVTADWFNWKNKMFAGSNMALRDRWRVRPDRLAVICGLVVFLLAIVHPRLTLSRMLTFTALVLAWPLPCCRASSSARPMPTCGWCPSCWPSPARDPLPAMSRSSAARLPRVLASLALAFLPLSRSHGKRDLEPGDRRQRPPPAADAARQAFDYLWLIDPPPSIRRLTWRCRRSGGPNGSALYRIRTGPATSGHDRAVDRRSLLQRGGLPRPCCTSG